MKKEIEVEVQTTTQCSFLPFTVVPDGWQGKKVKVVLICEERTFELETESEVPWK